MAAKKTLQNLKLTIVFMASTFLFLCTSYGKVTLEDRYTPESFSKYELSLDNEGLKAVVFKVVKDEPHLNPNYFDLYFQCGPHKAFQKIERNFGQYKNELTYCGNESPAVQKMEGKDYLSLPFKLADSERGCPAKANRKEVFSIQELKQKCALSVSKK